MTIPNIATFDHGTHVSKKILHVLKLPWLHLGMHLGSLTAKAPEKWWDWKTSLSYWDGPFSGAFAVKLRGGETNPPTFWKHFHPQNPFSVNPGFASRFLGRVPWLGWVWFGGETSPVWSLVQKWWYLDVQLEVSKFKWLVNGLYPQYTPFISRWNNPFTNHLLTSWDIQVPGTGFSPVFCSDVFATWGDVPNLTNSVFFFKLRGKI